ncbi:unnamed protein product, partial [Effrenium voratum]
EDGGARRLFQKYAGYSAHVRRSVYCRPDLWREGLRETVEADWPEYRGCSLMLCRPAYQKSCSLSPEEWKACFLEEDVEELQRRKQHHVHLPGPNGQRQPLAHCQDPRDPSKCKSGFPRDNALVDEAVLVCLGLGQQFELPVKGKRSLLGACWGPMNEPNLNGNHPAFLAALRCNGDLQLPYRFPVTVQNHNDALCKENCAGARSIRSMIREAQLNQAAQAGYSCDYGNKRLPIARAEIQEWQRGQRDLAADLENKPVGYLAARSNKRLITDIYSRGVCRGAVECCNLIVNSGKNDPTSAETIKTAPVTDISLSFGLRLMEVAATGEPWPVEPRREQPDKRAFGLRQTVSRPAFWTFYGSRGRDPRIFELSAFEFARHFQCAVAKHPRKVADLGYEDEVFHAYLTDEGQKLLKRFRHAALLPGVHYRVKDAGGADWVALSHGALGQTFRHDWVAALRRRPNVPVVQGALGSRCDEDTAKKVLLLFFPWTNDPSEATSRVPYLSSFKAPGVKTWRHALRFRLLRDGFPTEEVKQFAQNFCFVYGLPRELQPSDKLEAWLENSDNEFEDEPMELEEEDLLAAQATRIKGAAQPGEAGGEEEEDAEAETPEDATAKAQRIARTEQMFQLSKEVWGGAAASGEGDPSFAQHYADMAAKQAVEDHDELEEAAKASRAKGAGLLGWLEAKRPNLNAKQQEILALVVERVLIECGLLAPEESSRQSGEPLVWLLHGPPGAGKSHVLKYLRELFEEQLGYVQGIDYEVAAFQAVNAADIKGKTIHNVCGLSADWKAVDRAVSKEVAKRMGLWRWLIIDEVSMVNARLLAQVDQRLRSAVPDAAAWKLDPVINSSRPFAGINVLFTGDFYQLPPPSGAYLGDVPYNRRPRAPDDLTAPDPLADYGRELFWGGAVQGVTELEERERCKDGWWNAVVDELRAGHLSERNWKYLHGLPVEGCALSDEERASRRRVVAGHSDPRLQEAKFKQAPVIVANNDAKFQINKDRALRYSKESGAPLRWAAAADRPGLALLQTQACDKAARVRWLQYHDRDTGNLCGMLPLAVGMKVALTEHLDRSEDKLLLRGATGFVHSWRWPPGARQPTHVYVKFQGAEWQLEGAPEPGLYPVTRQTKVWFLDGGRPKPVLRISRTQIPLVPAYAITAHGSQGKTLPAAMADFNVDRWTDITFGTVAGSRVRSREDILILRPFPLWLFQRGAPEGPELLLKTLRGEKIDWVNYREARAPSAPCQQCKVVKPFDYFADAQWDKARANLPATCLTCIHKDGGACKRKLPSNVERLRCICCGFEKVEHAFPRAQLRQPRAEERRNCIACLKNVSELTCSQCAEVKPLKEFHLSALTLPWAAACQSCQDAVRGKARRLRAGWEKCRGCAAFLPTSSAVYINQRCPNCAADRKWGEHTCLRCKRKWSENSAEEQIRKRFCPNCR